MTQYRCYPDLIECLVRYSKETMLWMRDKGVRFIPIYGRQAFKVDGKFTFWGGLTVESVGGGPGLVDSLTRACLKRGIDIQYDTRAVELASDGKNVTVVVVRRGGERPETLHGILVLAGKLRKCGVLVSTPATVSRWHWTLAQLLMGTGPVVTQ